MSLLSNHSVLHVPQICNYSVLHVPQMCNHTVINICHSNKIYILYIKYMCAQTQININDLPNVTNSPTFLFANDTKIFREIKHQEDLKTLQEDL